MANRTAYPLDTDLIDLFNAAGLANATSEDVLETIATSSDSYVASAISRWEDETDFHPFLADTADSTRYYDPPGAERNHSGYGYVQRGGGKVVEIDGGLVSITSVTTGLLYDPTGTPVGGTSRIANVDFITGPANNAAQKRPIEWLEFFYRLYGVPRSIAVTGKFGFSTILVEDDWRAVLCGAAAAARSEIEAQLNTGTLVWKANTSMEQTMQEPWKRTFDGWETTFVKRAAFRHRFHMGV